jgi:hypothetical protein
MVEGSDEEVHRAELILNHGGIQDWGVYNAAARDREPNAYPNGTLYSEDTSYAGGTPVPGSHDPAVYPAGTLYPEGTSNVNVSRRDPG